MSVREHTSFPDPDSGATMEKQAETIPVEVHAISPADSHHLLLVTIYHVLNDMEVTYDERTVPLHTSIHGSYYIEAENPDLQYLQPGKSVNIEIDGDIIRRVIRT